LRGFLRPRCGGSFPLQIALRLAAGKLEAGKYYLVQLQGNRVFNMAGMGVFASRHHLAMQDTVDVAIAGCLEPDVFQALLGSPGTWQLVYRQSADGINADDGSPVNVILDARLSLGHTKRIYEIGQKWLKRFAPGSA
jgi:hypothetical protein